MKCVRLRLGAKCRGGKRRRSGGAANIEYKCVLSFVGSVKALFFDHGRQNELWERLCEHFSKGSSGATKVLLKQFTKPLLQLIYTPYGSV